MTDEEKIHLLDPTELIIFTYLRKLAIRTYLRSKSFVPAYVSESDMWTILSAIFGEDENAPTVDEFLQSIRTLSYKQLIVCHPVGRSQRGSRDPWKGPWAYKLTEADLKKYDRRVVFSPKIEESTLDFEL